MKNDQVEQEKNSSGEAVSSPRPAHQDFRFCKHKRLTKAFRCVRCKVEVVLQRFWNHGNGARSYGQLRTANPCAPNTHEFFSWDCGWLDGQEA